MFLRLALFAVYSNEDMISLYLCSLEQSTNLDQDMLSCIIFTIVLIYLSTSVTQIYNSTCAGRGSKN